MGEDVLFGAVALFCREDSEISPDLVDDEERQYQPQTNVLAIPTAVSLCLARFLKVSALDHPHLCLYVDLQPCRTAQNVVTLVSEHFTTTLPQYLESNRADTNQVLQNSSIQMAEAVRYCHQNLVVIGHITADDVLVANTAPFAIKLARYGLYHVGFGCVNHVIGSVYYLAPERFATLDSGCYATFKSDVWAIGMLLMEVFGRFRFKDLWGIKQAHSVMTSLIKNAGKASIYPLLIERIRSAVSELRKIPENLEKIIEKCLIVQPSKRLDSEELLQSMHECFDDDGNKGSPVFEMDPTKLRLLDRSTVPDRFPARPVREQYYLWNLCGPDVSTILVSRQMIRMNAPIRAIPTLVVDDFHQAGNEEMRTVRVNTDVVPLPCKNLNERLRPLNRLPFRDSLEVGAHTPDKYPQQQQQQSLAVKERDLDYQTLRMCKVARLLHAHPFKADQLRYELTKDVPPVYRDRCWAVLLDVHAEEARQMFAGVDCVSEQPSDRQLQVDIPRCHQYDELMATPAAHYKLKVLLKAWLSVETDYVYWQGLDSLAAPFLYLNFNNIQYLSVFMQLLALNDARLFQHMLQLDFQPELFAISWFLTCFAHVLPLHKVFQLWDSLLLADSSFPLFVGVALLSHFRTPLMNAQFNDAILLFSDLPDIPIDDIVNASWRLYNRTPVGCAYRLNCSQHRRRNDQYGPQASRPLPTWLDCPSPFVYNPDLKKLINNEQVLMIDLRSDFLHNRLSIPGSVCCPFEEDAYTDDGFRRTVGNAADLAARNQHFVCLIDVDPFRNAVKASKHLVRGGVNQVCIYADDIAALYA